MDTAKSFPSVWVTPSGSLAYGVIPKCGCSTIKQIMHYADHGSFYVGERISEGFHTWADEESRPAIVTAAEGGAIRFTCVRNPYRRLLSAFFDKISTRGENGKFYRQRQMRDDLRAYGIRREQGQNPDAQIRNFRRFVLFARDAKRFKSPSPPDLHWAAISGYVQRYVRGGGRYDAIFPLERLNEGMQKVLDQAQTPYKVDLGSVPRFNESAENGPKRAHPVEAYFDDLTIQIMMDAYGRDFDLFGYDATNPAREAPVREPDLDRIHATLLA
ncbi:sulfotransferase family protein [Halodurantibacterium flavum]|uniref:Sulfotransferase family protein n=1 Tax=Halodurantibacterium flavum TaxID=1382802 RepID=A0ABW4S1U4_9RHOB